MSSSVLVIVLTCLLGLTTTQQEGQIACWECTIEKSMDNRVLGIIDEVLHKQVQGTQCENRVCTGAGQDWCLVTHYKMRATDGAPESKRERHECGNRNYRDSDTRCKALLTEDKDHNKIIESSCYTKRSGSKSLHSSFTVYLSVILSLAAFAFMH